VILEATLALALVQQADAAVVRELENIEHALASTYKAGDCAAWGALLAPEWTVTHISSAVITKAEALQTCAAAKGTIAEMDISDIRARVYGDTAVVSGRTRVSTSGASPITVSLRFTDVFVRQGGRWLAVSSHATRIGG
jgi:ketosteroid isomerase-like protein